MSKESFAERALLEALAGARTLRSSAPEYDRAFVDNLMAVYGHLLDFVGVLHRESRHFIEAERIALDALESANAVIGEWESAAESVADSPDVLAARLEQLDAENARLNARVEELEAREREAARS